MDQFPVAVFAVRPVIDPTGNGRKEQGTVRMADESGFRPLAKKFLRAICTVHDSKIQEVINLSEVDHCYHLG